MPEVLFTLPRRWRRATVVAHIAASVGWLGLSLCLLVLAATARTATDQATVVAGYRAMAVLASTLTIPVSGTALLTGIVLAAGRPWGLTRQWWLLAKLGLTLAATAASILALPVLIDRAVRAAPHPDPSTANNLVIASTVAVATYTALVAISVVKPWGRRRPGGHRGAGGG